MPGNSQGTSSPAPASPRNTAKYTNKDGSKFITVAKGTPSDPSQPSTPDMAPSSDAIDTRVNGPAPPVNRKKQKRRQKAAAKAAAEQAVNGHDTQLADPPARPLSDHEAALTDDEAEAEADPNDINDSHQKSKKSKKKKKKGAHSGDGYDDSGALARPGDLDRPPSPLPLAPPGPGMSRDKIWSTNNQEERERIKDFWLGLGEDERKSLVKLEKDAVLKKMKEQQKHTCSCTVCGRKRTAIEEELEGLYDAYYKELEQFANQGEGPPMLSAPGNFPLRPPRPLSTGYNGQPPSRGRIVEHVGDDDDEVDDNYADYSEDEVEDDEYSDDEPPEEFQNPHDRDMADFLTFGNSLQVKGTQLLDSFLRQYSNLDLGGILTVADDLLKNEGKRFIEMMEQLAERRMAREEDARDHFARGYGHPNGSYSASHTHPPEEDEYEDEEDEEEDYDSQDEEYDDEEVYSNPSEMPPKSYTECCCQDQLTEEQRMEEGRRMFQIFAARMFEQRVLSAYKEKVAKERQQKLLEELEDEIRQEDQQKAKKAKNAQKKKDKAAQKKQALAEEKQRKDAEKAAEEQARLEAEVKRATEQKHKAEEKRRQKEAQKKAEEDARLKKESDRQRRLNEQREKQAEQERKAREVKEREKRLRDEQRLKEKEARDQKEREAQERKDKQDRDKKEKEARALKAQKEALDVKEAKERAKEEKAAQRAAAQAAQTAALAVQAQQSPSAPTRRIQQPPVTIPTVLPQHPPNPNNYASPKIPVATPAIPKAPLTMRPRNPSQQNDAALSGQPTQATAQTPPITVRDLDQSPHPSTPATDATSPIPNELYQQQRKTSGGIGPSLMPQHSESASPASSNSRGHGQPTPFQMPPPGMQPPPGLQHHVPPGLGPRMGHENMYLGGFRPNPNMMGPPPGIGGPPGRGFPPFPIPPPNFAQGGLEQFPPSHGFSMPRDIPPPSHARRDSSGFEGSPLAQPIGTRPAPIGRPGSVLHGTSNSAGDDKQGLGSRALLEDDDAPPDLSSGAMRNPPPGFRHANSFGNPFMEPLLGMAHNPWGPQGASHGFPPPGYGSAAGWGAPAAPPGLPVGSPGSGIGIRTAAQPRHVLVRLMLRQACQDLSRSSMADGDGFIDLGAIRMQIEAETSDNSITDSYLLNLCDTEGSPSNGGGAFDVRRDASGPSKHSVRWVPDIHDGPMPQHRAVGAPGEIGSPLVSQAPVRGM